MDTVDLFAPMDLAAQLEASAPVLLRATDALSEPVVRTFQSCVNARLLLEDVVPHRVVPQLLRGVVGAYIAGYHVVLATPADASCCVEDLGFDAIQTLNARFAAFSEIMRCVPLLAKLRSVTASHAFDAHGASAHFMRHITAPSSHDSLEKVDLSHCEHVNTRSVRQLTALRRLVHLDLSDCASLRPTALPYIGQMASLEHLNIERLKRNRSGAPISLVGLETLTRLKVLILGKHRLESLAPLQHLVSLESLSLYRVVYPSRHLRYLVGLMQLTSLRISNASIGVSRIPHLATLMLDSRNTFSGGECDEILRSRKLETLRLTWASIPSPLINHMAMALPALTSLNITSSDAPADVIATVSSVTTLTQLAVGVRADDDLLQLRALTLLTDVDLYIYSGTLNLSSFFENLATAVPKLHRVVVARFFNCVTGDALRHLTACRHLAHLHLRSAKWDVSVFDVLKQFSRLKSLELDVGTMALSSEAALCLGSMSCLEEATLGVSKHREQLQRAVPRAVIRG